MCENISKPGEHKKSAAKLPHSKQAAKSWFGRPMFKWSFGVVCKAESESAKKRLQKGTPIKAADPPLFSCLSQQLVENHQNRQYRHQDHPFISILILLYYKAGGIVKRKNFYKTNVPNLRVRDVCHINYILGETFANNGHMRPAESGLLPQFPGP